MKPTQKTRRFVRLFKPQFAELVEQGRKLQTVRPTPKRRPAPGDLISLRCWTGAPYRGKQRGLREATIVAVKSITIGKRHFWIEGNEHFAGATITHPSALDDFARADGFATWAELTAWFENTHSQPFKGIVIYWK